MSDSDPLPHIPPSPVPVGGIHVSGGSVVVDGDLVGGDKYVGYTAEQVNVLLTRIQTEYRPKPFDGRSPYIGLASFQERDADKFFGRETLTAELATRVAASAASNARAVFVAGPSGSGKSSLVRAGLIPALRRGAPLWLPVPSSEHWLYETLKPGRAPLDELARVVSSFTNSPDAGDDLRTHAFDDATRLHRWADIALKGDASRRAVIVIDQFEEIFTQLSSERESERVAFLNLLTHAATIENGRVLVIFTLRSDFVTNCASYPNLNALVNQQFIQVGAMTPDELVSAIARPALQVGLRIDPALIAQIVNDVRGEPGALPLMQFALQDLFEAEKSKGELTLDGYLARGGLHQALERHANAEFEKLDEQEQKLARTVFSGLIEIGRGREDTKRTALFSELVPAGADAARVKILITKLADARLITTDEQEGKETVTLAHERLIDAWDWLRKLVDENRDAIALQNEIAQDAQEWDRCQRDADYLYTGARLATAQEQVDAKKIALSALAQDFVQAGVNVREQIIKREQQRTRRLILAFGAAAGILATMFLIVLISTGQTRVQSRINDARRIAAIAVSKRNTQLDLALILSAQAARMDVNLETRRTLLENLENHPIKTFLHGHKSAVNAVAFGPDGKILASGSDDKTIILWDVDRHQPIGDLLTGHTDAVTSIAFTPDGKILASGSDDKTIIFWDVDRHQPIGEPLGGHTSSVTSVTISPNGRLLASGSNGTIILWDVTTNRPIAPSLQESATGLSLAFSPDGRILASAGCSAMYPTGDCLAGQIRLWDVETLKPIGKPFEVCGIVRTVTFSPNGRILAFGGWSPPTIIEWSGNEYQRVEVLRDGETDWVNSVAFSPDGETLASASSDQSVILWDTSIHSRLGEPLMGHSGKVSSVAFSPDGKTLASASSDNMIILWDTTTSQPISRLLTAKEKSQVGTEFDSVGKIKASGGCSKWVGAGRYSYCAQGMIELWDLETNTPFGQPLIGHDGDVNCVRISPDGKLVASASDDQTVILWDLATQPPIGQPLRKHQGSVNCVAFSPDGKLLASASDDATVILWDLATQRLIEEPLDHNGPVTSVTFSADGLTLASAACVIVGHARDCKEIYLWDVRTHQSIGQPLVDRREVSSVVFSARGDLLFSKNDFNDVTLWETGVEAWISHACSIANRNLTRLEWEQYIKSGDDKWEEYAKNPTCHNLPVE